MVYLTIEDFDHCISDCDRAIELNKSYVKVITIPHSLSSISFTFMSLSINMCVYRLTSVKLKP